MQTSTTMLSHPARPGGGSADDRPGGSPRIRDWNPDSDISFVREAVVGLQELERSLDARLPTGESMADAYIVSLLERCARWRGRLLIAEDGVRRIGFLSLFLAVPPDGPDEPGAPYALISDLMVVPEASGRGVGGALLDRAERIARADGAPVMRLEVMFGNLRARRFYDERGWRDRVVQMEKILE